MTGRPAVGVPGAVESGGEIRQIVVVEDSDEDFESLQRAFGKVAAQVELVRHRTGRDLFAQQPPTMPLLVVLDLNLPGENGIRILHRLRSHADWRTTPAIVFSGSARRDDVAAAYAGGAAGYLVKPFDPAGLVTQVTALWAWWGQTVQPPPVEWPVQAAFA
jgi:DNA-binding response OmpR family regulator